MDWPHFTGLPRMLFSGKKKKKIGKVLDVRRGDRQRRSPYSADIRGRLKGFAGEIENEE